MWGKGLGFAKLRNLLLVSYLTYDCIIFLHVIITAFHFYSLIILIIR